MNESYLDSLKAKGWQENQDGSWTKRPLRDMGQLGGTKRERSQKPALVGRIPAYQKGKRSLAVRVEIISFRKRLLDTDNNSISTKGLQDAISRSLGIDDGDPRISWSYQQLKTTTPGTLVKICVTHSE